MVVSSLDTLKFSQTLIAAGVPKEQAEAQATVFADVLKVNFQELVTLDAFRSDNALMRAEFRMDLREFQQRLETKIDNLEQQLDAKINGVEQRLDAKIGLETAKLNGEMILIKWMLGVILTLLVAILVRLFIFPSPSA